MRWVTWKCRQTITAAASDWYRSSLIRENTLVLGRNKGFLEVYKIGRHLKKRIEFRSHISCFDYLRSAEIGEGIDSIDILPSGNREVHIVSANAKLIKLWNVRASYVQEKTDVRVVECCSEESSSEEQEEDRSKEQPGIEEKTEKERSSKLKEIFQKPRKKNHLVSLKKECAPENAYSIHSVSSSIDKEHILVSDELSIILYNAELEKKLKIVNIKPQRNEELNKIISSAKFSPHASSIFLYGTSNGSLEIHDLRECIQSAPVIGIPAKHTGDFYDEIVRPISDVVFVSDTLIASRDLLSVLVYDTRSPKVPMQEHDVYPLVRKKVADLYDSDEIFSKFSMGVQDQKIYTGSFNTAVAEIDVQTGEAQRSFLDESLEEATRIVDSKKVSCVSIDGDCLVAAISNQCYIFRPSKKSSGAEEEGVY